MKPTPMHTTRAFSLADLPLGKSSTYIDHYDASLLQPVPRALARAGLPLPDPPPFRGADLWHLYELSWLNANGLPQVAIGKVQVNAHSLNLVESKSFKLYLNSFNQTPFPGWQAVAHTIERDLTACVQGQVSVALTPLAHFSGQPLTTLAGACLDDQDIPITHYQPHEDYLARAARPPRVCETWVSHLLKSNCLITRQPDWGSVQIRYCGNKIDPENLLRYLVSLRQHNEFHEHCVERIFCDIWRLCQPETLSVYACYTRRGGLDINPWRSNDPGFTPADGRLARQ